MAISIRACVHEIARRFAAADLYYGHGTDNAHDEAVYLVFAALDLPFDCPESALDEALDNAQLARIRELARQRIEKRVPTAYLVNRAWFCGLPFYVDEHVLIPRSPVAELIEAEFSPWLEADRIGRVLDIGTGSGCIAIACAYALPQARVDAIDNDRAALAIAQRNIDAHGLGARVAAIESDLFSALDDCRYDLIIANPPYVDAQDMADLPPEYAHEPAAALAAGDDGLAVVERLLNEARDHLTADGLLVLEVGNSQAALEAARPALPMLWLDCEMGGDGVCIIEARDLG
ncbi:ribosomal protein L3 glutamine methyltransferase [Methylohalomonas lacus]|uniref:Ribosomal protein L3 glutamine methyltransferase n=1 Tax=Methylohalomonas lacus TaxID=398773 RepID=A0AAE3HLJ5_9GAMM|nr:50S ribosomal protein L3 N(5)-glutamine methyltransferase [Methylohalomonas lacus]MCS3904560.1 ribosomal protein L3 glutamine methyltransferase [Methylohalomonas lacus]